MKKLSKKIVFVALLLMGGTAVGYALSSDNVVKAEVEQDVKPEVKQTSYRWFKINNTHAANSPVPSADAVFLNTGPAPEIPEDMECEGATNQCISGFDSSQTTASGSGYALVGSQAPNSSAPNLLKD